MFDFEHILDESMLSLAEELAISEHELMILIVHGALDIGISLRKALENPDIKDREIAELKMERIDKFVAMAGFYIIGRMRT